MRSGHFRLTKQAELELQSGKVTAHWRCNEVACGVLCKEYTNKTEHVEIECQHK